MGRVGGGGGEFAASYLLLTAPALQYLELLHEHLRTSRRCRRRLTHIQGRRIRLSVQHLQEYLLLNEEQAPVVVEIGALHGGEEFLQVGPSAGEAQLTGEGDVTSVLVVGVFRFLCVCCLLFVFVFVFVFGG